MTCAEVIGEFDEGLSFLDGFVKEAVENKGMKRYIDIELREDLAPSRARLRFQWERERVWGPEGMNVQDIYEGKFEVDEGKTGLNTSGVVSIWGEKGLIGSERGPEINLMPREIKDLLESGGKMLIVHECEQFRCRMLARDARILLEIKNLSVTNPLINVSIEVTGPQLLQRTMMLVWPFNLEMVAPESVVYYQATFEFQQRVGGFPELQFTCQIKYNNLAVVAELPVTLAMFIVPVPMTSSQFEALWRQGGSELVISSEESGTGNASNILGKELNLKPIKQIGNEEIFAGKLLSTPLFILVHLKRIARKVTVKVLTKSRVLSDAIGTFMKQRINVYKML
jgi:hypothetical protein